MSKLEELEAVLWKVHNYHDKLKSQRDDHRRTLVAEMEKALNERFGDAISKAFENESKARKEFEAERDRVAVEEAPGKMQFPEGTVIVKWEKNWHDDGYCPTKRFQVCIFRQEDPLPRNISRYSRPNVGAIVMREILKDGSLSKRCEGVSGGWRLWLPEGQVPEGVRVADKYKIGGAKK